MRFEDEKNELMRLAYANDGILLVDDIVDSARDELSPLHRHFTWDDSIAAAAHRRWQARVLTAKCLITIEPRTDTKVRAFVSLSTDRYHSLGGYRLLTDVQSNHEQLAVLLADINRSILRWQKQATLMNPEIRQALQSLSTAVTQFHGEDDRFVA